MLPKKGRVFPKAKRAGSYAAVIADALRSELGSTHQAVKVIRRWTGAGERTVKNWLSASSGPSGHHLVELIQHSDVVLDALLALSGRQESMVVHRLYDLRMQLASTLMEMDRLMNHRPPDGRVR
jgi:hypothetical protein